MCAIVGLLGRDDASLVRRMADRIAHRGPDGGGVFTDDGVTLGHRRLAILDPERGAQPMTSGDATIVYNGECYNHLALRAELEAAGVAFHGRTDTETVLEGYRAWGPAVAAKMEGMFAFAVWDAKDRSLVVARDPFGVKPFFHARTADGDWAFASEQKALLAHPGIDAVPDLDRLRERAALEFLTGQATLFRGVRQLPPGTWARVRPGDTRVEWQPYYQVTAERFATAGDAASEVRRRFEASVEEQLLSDVPLGVVLSGGLDSAAVAAVHQRIASGRGDGPIHTFTVADDEGVEDFRQSRRLAEHLGTEHHEALFTLEDVLRDLPRYAWHNENINYTEFFFLPLFELARRHVKVALSGQGSDELWGGYARYQDPGPLARERLARIRRAAPAHQEELCTQVAHAHTSGSSLAEWDQQGQLSNFQLRLVDRSSMAHSLEVRVPFLSRSQHRASRAVPWGWKEHDGTEKWILRRALGGVGLPEDIVWRRKVAAGRATSPGVMAAFEAYAARLVTPAAMERHPLAGSFRLPAEQLAYDLWAEVFLHRDGHIRGLSLEDLA